MNINNFVNDPQSTASDMWYKHQIARRDDVNWELKPSKDKLLHFRDLGFDNFVNKYPIISRQMIVNGEYHSLAFAGFLKNDEKSGSGRDEWAHVRALYIKDLWINYNAKGSSKRRKKLKSSDKASKIYDETKESLLGELTSFKEDYDEAKSTSDIRSSERVAEIRATLKNLFVKNPHAIRGII